MTIIWTCPKCGDGFPPLKIHFHKLQCDGKSKLIKGTKPGHVSAKSTRMTSAELRRARAIEADLRGAMLFPARSRKKVSMNRKALARLSEAPKHQNPSGIA